MGIDIIPHKTVIVIVGPTGTGKSRLAIDLAQKFNGEIINADSRQVYLDMDIGTAKPSIEELSIVPHHLFNLIHPNEEFSLAQYQELAYKTISDVQKRSKIPFLVGGSGQYVWGVLEGWEIPRIPPDYDLRRKLEYLAEEKGIDILYQKLLEIDSESAQKIDKRNIRRVIRALEVSLQSQSSFSKLKKKKDPGFRSLIIGLTGEREELYRRTDKRIDIMFAHGLIDETEALLKKGYSLDLPSMSSIGYKQIEMMLKGEINKLEAIRQIQTNTHRFIRHQYAWFRLRDERIHWFDIQNQIKIEIMILISNYLQG